MPVDKFGLGDNSSNCGTPRGSPVGLIHRAGDTMLGVLSMGGFQLKDVGQPLDSTDTATKEYVDTRDVLPASGGSMRGALDMGGNEIVGLADPTAAQSAAPKKYVDALVRNTTTLVDSMVLQLDGSKAPTHDIGWGNHKITELADPKAPQDAVTKAYVDKKTGPVGRRIDRYLLVLEWKPSVSATLESVGGLKLSDLAPKSVGLRIKKPGFYTIMFVGTHAWDDTPYLEIALRVHSPHVVVQKYAVQGGGFNFTNIVEILRENTFVSLDVTNAPQVLGPKPVVFRATLLIEKLL